jgi:AAHS family 4-hydroxybenzoate transporter-like MFS transporter
MAGEAEIQVSRLLDERGLSAFQIKVLVWSVFIALIDGYDIGAIAFAAPHLVTSWGISRSALGPVLTANNIGALFGALLLGFVGDRYGRKTALISANLLFGVLTFAAAYSTDLTQLFWLRLVAGFGIGGVMPNIVALNAESAPRRLRAAPWPASPARRWSLTTAGRSCSTSVASPRSCSRSPPSAACRNRSNTWRCMPASGCGWKR